MKKKMESNLNENKNNPEEFQRFIYELFNKNGILNDLRAYLRGHIVDILKHAEIGMYILELRMKYIFT